MILKDFQQRLSGSLPFAPHDMRRTYATRLFEMGAVIDTVKKSDETLVDYDHPALRQAWRGRNEACFSHGSTLTLETNTNDRAV